MGGTGQTRLELMEAAARLFEERGYKGTSVRDIASATGTSISNIYHHFGNKEGLWTEIQKSSVTNLPRKLREALEHEADALERFKRMLRVHLQVGQEFRRESRIFFFDNDRLESTRNRANRKLQREILDIYVEQVASLRKLGLVRSRHATITAFNILGVMNWFLRWYLPEGRLSARKVQDEIIAFILRGMGVPE